MTNFKNKAHSGIQKSTDGLQINEETQSNEDSSQIDQSYDDSSSLQKSQIKNAKFSDQQAAPKNKEKKF